MIQKIDIICILIIVCVCSCSFPSTSEKANRFRRTYYENGQLRSITQMEDTVANGIEVTFYPNGEIESLLHYLENRVVGNAYFFYDSVFYNSGSLKNILALKRGHVKEYFFFGRFGLWIQYVKYNREGYPIENVGKSIRTVYTKPISVKYNTTPIVIEVSIPPLSTEHYLQVSLTNEGVYMKDNFSLTAARNYYTVMFEGSGSWERADLTAIHTYKFVGNSKEIKDTFNLELVMENGR